MKIQILYIDECASYQNAREWLEQVLAEEGMYAPIEMIRVTDEEDAVNKQFVGSPTLRVDGADLFPEQTSNVYAIQCRVYRTAQGFKGTPTKEMLRAAILQRAGA